ncbi:hypothetical protein QVD17_20724 [Tagetes erecta]|uniref:Uncharacterized protein n=1 Tax=Tagetes erecta TaxID=13708 RepID=A0AAD8NY65_TARER|nr:hypothetical protein QVD17_20724 [Tagetes erecta]
MVLASRSILFVGFLVVLCGHRVYANGCYSSIISFGDSIADTGNLKQMASSSDVKFSCGPPYGQNFISRSATGRCSNGRLIIDFLAESLGLPLVPPYFNDNGSGVEAGFRQGVNYAVGGATAMDSSFMEAIWPERPVINASLRVQLSWFKQSLSSICGNVSDCRNFIGQSLILMGEIGGNDYNHPLSAGKPLDEIKPYVPLVIDTIVSVINELIEMGVRTLVVPGNFPVGCFPSTLSIYGSDSEEYDPITGCLTKLNEFVEYHNTMLQAKLDQIRELNPNVTVMYADYYNSIMQAYHSPYEYGFTSNGTRKTCCGYGEPFNFSLAKKCGDSSVKVCDEPDAYVSWDGIHLTEAAYKLIFKSLFQGPYTTPAFNSLCPTSSSHAKVGLSSSI